MTPRRDAGPNDVALSDGPTAGDRRTTPFTNWSPIRCAIGVSACIAAVSIAINLTFMHQFSALGFFFLDDTLFNSDPMSMLEVLGQGTRSISIMYPELRNSIHPYLWLYFAPIIRVLAKIVIAVGASDLNEPQLRAMMGTFVIPIVAMLQSVIFGLLAFAMGLRIRHVILVSLLNVAMFSNLIFGAIPEHFAVTNLSITALLLISAISMNRRRLAGLWAWIAAGSISTGITITNVVAFAIIRAGTVLSDRSAPTVRALAASGLLSLAIGLCVLGSAHLIGVAIDGPLQRGSIRDNFVPRYFRDDTFTWHAPLRALSALGNAVAPDGSDIRTTPPTPVPTPHYAELTAPFATSPFPTYTLESAPGSLPGIGIIGIIAIVAMALGAMTMVSRPGPPRSLGLMSLALIGYNMALHMVWGDEFFIYSQHWITPALILLSGLLMAPAKIRPISEAACALIAVAVAWNNISVIVALLTAARTTAGIQ